MAQHRHVLIDREEWARLHRWLSFFSEDVVNQQAELLIMEAWLENFRSQYAEMLAVLDRVEAHLAQITPDAADHIRGEICVLRGNFVAFSGNVRDALPLVQQALQLLRPDWHYATTAAKMILIACYHLIGDRARAYKELYRLLDKADLEDRTRHNTLLLYINCVLQWVDADLPALAQVAGRYLEIGQKLKLAESVAMANLFLGITHYHLNELAVAEQCLASVANSGYKLHTYFYMQGSLALAQVYHSQSNAEQARKTVEQLRANLLEMQSGPLLPVAEAFQAELNLNTGKLARAGTWATQYDPMPLILMHNFYVPQLTLVKVWLTQNSETSRKQAADLLTQLQEFVERTHNTRFLIEVLALQALLANAHGDEVIARDKLAQAVHLAQPGGFIRLFVDLGPQMADLLRRLRSQGAVPQYIGQILDAFPADLRSKTNRIGNLLEPLTESLKF